VDLNYTQNLRLTPRYTVQLAVDVFNVFDKQTGYNYDPSIHNPTFGTPRNYWDPRHMQVTARFQF
jgi:hypothetical protein